MTLESVLGSYEKNGRSPRIYEDMGHFSQKYKTPDAIKSLNRPIGYTDKLLKEIEDWGVIYFKTVFDNLKRMGPLGAAYRYLQTNWTCISKKIK